MLSRRERYEREQARRAGAPAPQLELDEPLIGDPPVTGEVVDTADDHADLDVTDKSDATAPALVALDFPGSSNVRAARFDAAASIVEIEFKGGKLYRYANFTPELMTAWRAAPSAGSWFDGNVKKRPDLHPLVPAAPTPKPEQ